VHADDDEVEYEYGPKVYKNDAEIMMMMIVLYVGLRVELCKNLLYIR
jgi:hypothetical protein